MNSEDSAVKKTIMASGFEPIPPVIANGMNISVLDVGVEFTYTVPSFSVFEAKWRQSTINIEKTMDLDFYMTVSFKLPQAFQTDHLLCHSMSPF